MGLFFYHIVSPLLQPTTFGKPAGEVTERVKRLAQIFRQAGFPVAVSPAMKAWQKSHVAWVSPVANALYMVGGNGSLLANRPDVVCLMVQAIREGFAVLMALGVPVTPSKLTAFNWLPLPLLVCVLRIWARTKHFDTVATRHTLAAFDEMELVSQDFQTLARTSGIETPVLDQLHTGLKNWKRQA